MACKCTCGRDIDCGDTLCPLCEAAADRSEGLPPGMKPEDYDA